MIPKFRAWNKIKKRMFLVLEIDYENELVSDETYWNTIPFNDVKLMQFTGLVDMYGKEIFEGDVLKTSDGELAKVVWNKELACWEAEFLDEIVDLSEVADVKIERSDCEIVGNIYENPELLEEE